MPVRPPRARWRRRALLLVVALLTTVLAGCGPDGEPELELGTAQASRPIAGGSQIVLRIRNHGDGDDRLVWADSSAAAGVELHRTEVTDGRAVMRELDGIDIPAGDEVYFRPGDLHLMLVIPDESVVVGGTFEVTLRFERSGEVTVPVEVVELLDLVDEVDAELGAHTAPTA